MLLRGNVSVLSNTICRQFRAHAPSGWRFGEPADRVCRIANHANGAKRRQKPKKNANHEALYIIAESPNHCKICLTHGVVVGFGQLCTTFSPQAQVRFLATVGKVQLFFLVEDFMMVQTSKT